MELLEERFKGPLQNIEEKSQHCHYLKKIASGQGLAKDLQPIREGEKHLSLPPEDPSSFRLCSSSQVPQLQGIWCSLPDSWGVHTHDICTHT